MTADDSNAPVEREPQRPREMPLGKMWLFGAMGAVAAIAAIVIAPANRPARVADAAPATGPHCRTTATAIGGIAHAFTSRA